MPKIHDLLKLAKKADLSIDEEIYLFGSYITGKADEWSDIDLAIVCDRYKNMDRFDMQFKLMNIAKEIDIDIEPHVFFKEDFNDMNPFVNTIITTGRKVA